MSRHTLLPISFIVISIISTIIYIKYVYNVYAICCHCSFHFIPHVIFMQCVCVCVCVFVCLSVLKSIMPKYFGSKFLFLSVRVCACVCVCAIVLMAQIMCNQCHITAKFSFYLMCAYRIHLSRCSSTYWFLLVSLLI